MIATWKFMFAMIILHTTWECEVSASDLSADEGRIKGEDILIRSIKIRDIRIPDPVLTPIPGIGLKLFLNELFIDLDFEWETLAKTTDLIIKLDGFGTVTSKVQVSFDMTFGNKMGQPSFNVTSCTSVAKEFDGLFKSKLYELSDPASLKPVFEIFFCGEAKKILQGYLNERNIDEWITLYEKATFEDNNEMPESKLVVLDEVTEAPLAEEQPVMDELIEVPLTEQPVMGEVAIMAEVEMDTESVVPLHYEKVAFPNTGETTEADLTSYETLGMTFPEEALNQVLMIPYKNGLNLTFEMDIWGGLAAILLLNWVQAEGPFRMNFYSPYTPTAYITRTGIYSYIEGSLDVGYKGAALKPSSSNMTFSCVMVFTAYLTSDYREMRFRPINLNLILRRAGFSLSGVNKVIGDHFAKVFLSSLASYFDFELPKFKRKSVVNPTVDQVPGYILFLSNVKRPTTSRRKG